MTPDVSWQSISIDVPGSPPSELDRTGAVALVPAGDRAFAAAAALTLARSLARGGRRVFLCDLDLQAPRLHIMAGVIRGPGVTDFVLYGSSPGHVATELEERLLFVSAGTPVVAYESVFASDRWASLMEAATHARACLLMFVPADLKGVQGVLARVDTVVALGRPGEVPDLGAASDRLRLGFRPADGSGDAPRSAPADASSALPDPLADASRAAAHPPVPDDDVWEADPAAVGPDPDEDDEPTMSLAAASAVNRANRKSPPKKSRAGWVFLILFLILVALVVAGWLGLIRVPGIVPRRADAEESQVMEASAPDPASAELGLAGADAPPAPAGVDASEAPVQAWTLRLGAFRDRPVARSEAARMAAAAPDHLFAVVPVDVSGARWYRVVSALVADADEAEAHRALLASALQVPDAEQWLARSAPLAFLVAEMDDAAAARGRADELAAGEIDAYVLTVPGADGRRWFRVYAGAYADAAEAGVMRRLLDGAGLGDAPLVERRGILPE